MFTGNPTGHRGVCFVERPSYFCVCLTVKNKRQKSLHCSGFHQFVNWKSIHKIAAMGARSALIAEEKASYYGMVLFFFLFFLFSVYLQKRSHEVAEQRQKSG